jgi:TetR/AcrR family transcriptional regulator
MSNLVATLADDGGAGAIRIATTAHILRAAEAVFAENGFAGASMTRLAAAANLPKANLHYYFGTKEKLYRAVLEDVLALWLDATACITRERHPRAALDEYIAAKMTHSRTRPEASRIFANEVLQGAPRLRSYLGLELRRRVDETAAVIEHWIARGLMRPVDPRHLLFAIWAMTQTYADFAPQVCAVLGVARLGAAEHTAALQTVRTLVLDGCGIAPLKTLQGDAT